MSRGLKIRPFKRRMSAVRRHAGASLVKIDASNAEPMSTKCVVVSGWPLHRFPFFFFLLLCCSMGPPVSTMTASSSLLLTDMEVIDLGLASGFSFSSSFMNSSRVLDLFLSHQSFSAGTCDCNSSMCLRISWLFATSLADWKMICPQLGANALAWALLVNYARHNIRNLVYLSNDVLEFLLHLLLCALESRP